MRGVPVRPGGRVDDAVRAARAASRAGRGHRRRRGGSRAGEVLSARGPRAPRYPSSDADFCSTGIAREWRRPARCACALAASRRLQRATSRALPEP